MSVLVSMGAVSFGPRAIASANSYGGGLVDTCAGAFMGGYGNPLGTTCDAMSWGALGVTYDVPKFGVVGDDVWCGMLDGTYDDGSVRGG